MSVLVGVQQAESTKKGFFLTDLQYIKGVISSPSPKRTKKCPLLI